MAALPTALPAAQPTTPEIRFNRDIRPVLSDHCFRCHGPDKNQRKAKLRLDHRETAVAKGAIVPSKPDESELIKRIFATDEDDIMPPPALHKELSPAQKNLLRDWIAAGAVYEPHWAYLTPVRSPVPGVKAERRVRTPVDAFVLDVLEKRKLEPAAMADKRTLLRRLSLDLIGLPPTPAEVNEFLRDGSARAYERQVERLLASPHFGERMAVGWLDVVRFADTVGYHGDQNQNIFPYRDYVINSFNRNKPFDQFTIEQLAGDLLPQPSVEQRVATGFNRLNMMTREGGAQPKEYLAKYAGDRVRTVAATWLGSTVGCAECHDHKYDPFTARDFYRLGAFFADVKEWGVYNDYSYTPNPDLKGWSNDHPFPPELEVESPYLQRRAARLGKEIDGLLQNLRRDAHTNRAVQREFVEWRRGAGSFLEQFPEGWAAPVPAVTLEPRPTNNTPATEHAIEAGNQVVFRGKITDKIQFELPLAEGWLSALRVELLPHAAHSNRVVRGNNSSPTLQLSASIVGASNETQKVQFYYADASQKEERYANGEAVVGIRGGWKLSAAHRDEPQTAIWLLDPPLKVAAGRRLRLNFSGAAVGSLRASVSPFAPRVPDLAAARATSAFPNAPLEVAALKRALSKTRNGNWWKNDAASHQFFLGTAWARAAFNDYKRLQTEWLECSGGRASTLITKTWAARPMRVLPRGNWQDESGEVVEPGPPQFLARDDSAGRRLTRLDLARWIVSPENPLTARTVVNRLWKQFFGTGLCASLDDLGTQGDVPSHPELLDWLAVEFRESGWNIKHMVRLMVLSSTYQQSSIGAPGLREIDPGNRLLAAQAPRRLDAELVRDNALSVAGLLNLDIGGPSARPYQPPGYYANLQFPDRDYYPHRDDRQYRRGVYTHWQRAFLHPMLANFDAPSREECTAQRIVSNTPQQALSLLNDPTFVEAARVFAAFLLQQRKLDDPGRIDAAFERALARGARAEEKASLLSFLRAQKDHYTAEPDEAKKLMANGLQPVPEQVAAAPSELAAWTSVCRVILNLHETITTY